MIVTDDNNDNDAITEMDNYIILVTIFKAPGGSFKSWVSIFKDTNAFQVIRSPQRVSSLQSCATSM